jgi:hypothetical protein
MYLSFKNLSYNKYTKTKRLKLMYQLIQFTFKPEELTPKRFDEKQSELNEIINTLKSSEYEDALKWLFENKMHVFNTSITHLINQLSPKQVHNSIDLILYNVNPKKDESLLYFSNIYDKLDVKEQLKINDKINIVLSRYLYNASKNTLDYRYIPTHALSLVKKYNIVLNEDYFNTFDTYPSMQDKDGETFFYDKIKTLDSVLTFFTIEKMNASDLYFNTMVENLTHFNEVLYEKELTIVKSFKAKEEANKLDSILKVSNKEKKIKL